MIIGLCGMSGTGKSSLCNELVKLGYNKVITDTTRPPREGEVDEVDYFFDTEEEFQELEDMGEFIETTSYKVASGATWRYGTTIGQLRDAGPNSVIVLNPQGVRALRNLEKSTKIVLINANKILLLSRLKSRGDNPKEIERRLAADEKDFEGIEQYADLIVKNDEKTNLRKLAKYIVKHLEQD